MPNTLSPLIHAQLIMFDWINLKPCIYEVTLFRFAKRLPPEEVLEAVRIAQRKVPEGGMDGFKYFCGVCHGKIEDQRIRFQLSRD